MTKILSGSELVGFIKERQAKQVRALRQSNRVFPKLAIVTSTQTSPAIELYVRMKQAYGADVLVETDIIVSQESSMIQTIAELNLDPTVHGIIVQLPLVSEIATDAVVNSIQPDKDVDGLGNNASFYSATAEAINWLLAAYSVELHGKKIVLVGKGRLVGAPLYAMWQKSGLDVDAVDKQTENLEVKIKHAEIIVTATGSPGAITSDMVAVGATIVDAGTASEDGAIVGDIASDVRKRDDLTITPEKGGVGPLTIAMLFDHVIQSATKITEHKSQ